MEKRNDFVDVCDDESFFEREGNTRNYVICTSCGFIPMSMVDSETKFLDLHCRCGSVAIYASFAEEEILAMLGEILDSMKSKNLLKDDVCNCMK